MAENIVILKLTLPDGRTAEATVDLAPGGGLPRVPAEEALETAARMLWHHAQTSPPIH